MKTIKDMALEVQDEDFITLTDILEGKIVKPVRSIRDAIEKELMEFDFILNGEKYRTESFDKEITLDKVRKQLNLN